MKADIYLNNINMYYSSSAFRENSIKSFVENLMKRGRCKHEIIDIHALKNISLEIKCGERVGLLGPNGAGKSSFLKMVAGLYPIASGERIVTGTIRALFDLSLGFEPDATGRDNILYRGLLLGMSPKAMREIEGDIIDFADIGEFIDYPIKTYSAGMMVRLAFAISTSIGGDLLLLDEIMGAGDASFREKAKRRISGLIDNAEILVFASHDIGSLTSICQRGVVFHHGEVIFDGDIGPAIEEYKHVNGLI